MRKELTAGNEISFCLYDYLNREEMFNDIGQTLDILTKNGYQCSFRYDDSDVYILEFNHDEPEYGCPMIYWLDEEQLSCLYSPSYLDEEYDQEA